MERIYYSRQNYNQLKRKQYEEYLKRQNMYYLYMRKQYEEYLKRQYNYYIYMRKQYEEYLKRQSMYYLYKKRYDEEQHKRNNDKTDIIEDKNINDDNIKNKNIKDDNIKNNIHGSLEINIKESNLKYKKDDSAQYDNLENKNCTSSEDSYNEEFSEENDEKYLEENNEEFSEENDEEFLGENDEEFLGKISKEYLEEKCEKFLEKKCEECLEENDKEFLEEKYEECLEEKYEECLEEKYEEYLEKKCEKYLEKKCEEFLEEKDKEFLEEDYNTVAKEELSKETNISTSSVYVKFPVILAETNITIPVEATITFDQRVMEIKEIKKKVFLTQSRLIPFSSGGIDPNSGILFIAGFIIKNIEYKTQTCTTAGTKNVCGDIRHCTVKVPFNFTTRLTFLRSPIFIEKTTTREVEFSTDRSKACDVCSDPVIGRDPCEQSSVFTEFFNEKPFVELIKATFIEVDIHNNAILSCGIPEEQMLNQITEKSIVNLTLKVLQKQQLRISMEQDSKKF